MTKKSPKVGDKLLWYGYVLTIGALHDRDGGIKLAEAVDEAGEEKRQEVRAQVLELREQQKDLDRGEHAEIAKQIEALHSEAHAAVVKAKLRVDLLTWWDERGAWVSEGRILSDEQSARFKAITGHKPTPEGQRAALDILQPVEA